MDASGLHYPNRFSRALLQALAHTAGPSSLGSVLDLAGLANRYGGELPPDDLETGMDFADIAAFCEGLEAMYGTRGGRGIALRVGGEMFTLGIQRVGVLRGIDTPEFKGLPTSAQAQIALVGLAAVFNDITDQTSRVLVEDDRLRFVVNPCASAWERTSDKPVCHLMAGVIQMALRWATDGYQFAVYETACQATGADACVFLVNKKPIGRV